MDKPIDVKMGSDEEQRLKKLIEECVDLKTEVAAFNQKIKDTKALISDEFKAYGVTPKRINWLVDRVFKNDARDQNDEITEGLDFLEQMGYYSHDVGL